MIEPTILIMAGQRLGQIDALAAAYGITHKCLVPLLGRPLIGYVFDAVDAAFPGSRIVVSINDPRALDDEPEAQRFFDTGRLTTVASERNLLESTFAAVEGADWPVLITTGDNVLMTPEALRDFHRFALDQRADAAAMFARKEDILAAHPEGQPRFWKFRDGEFSGCNTFWMKDRAALAVAEIFRGGGQFLKFPRRFIGAFGLSNLIGFRLRLFDTNRMLARVSRRFGKTVKVRVADSGELAIDVDTRFSHTVAERLLRKRGVSG
ncbi:MAG: nucleotidyltransferase family protein [Candidatus Andeanibacterium colombiense]|uniref:Nucleotidyltransferase family protein n=1 Tax=Candidatus Andeanibacterium colombiense TaxID=3121345 RepID=A0AAJ5X6S8_9SPHN|nr:MAG: nucleotidyltransferase family protein [Sphingomonadaceae bacterium]